MRDVFAVGLMVALASVGCNSEQDRTFNAPEGGQGGTAGVGTETTNAGESSELGGSASTGGAADMTGPTDTTPDEGSSAAGGAGGAPDTGETAACTEDEYDDGTGCQPLTICRD